jgi:VanZ family protein
MAWAILILFLTGVPGNYFPTVISFWDWLSPDKVVHLVIFAVQAYLIIYGMQPQYLNKRQRYLLVIIGTLATILFGLITEVLQSYVFIGRDGNIFDFLADGLGALIGLVAYYLLNIRNSVLNFNKKQ